MKPWGTEITFTAPESPYCMKVLIVASGQRLSLQTHSEKDETLVLESGLAEITVGDNTTVMIQRKPFHIAPNVPHRVKVFTECVIYEASTPETGITIRHEDDYGRGDD